MRESVGRAGRSTAVRPAVNREGTSRKRLARDDKYTEGGSDDEGYNRVGGRPTGSPQHRVWLGVRVTVGGVNGGTDR